jgi:hypothetical protein
LFITLAAKHLAGTTGKQIPHWLKPVRDDKNKEFVTTQLKLRSFKHNHEISS